MTKPAVGDQLSRHLEWMRAGTQVLLDVAHSLADTDPRAATPLEGWTRAHLLGHVALNASALTNLLTWARSGVVTPMYSSREARAADIEANSTLPMAALLNGIDVTARQLDEAAASLPHAAWSAKITTAAGREAPASIVPWMRVREVWVHAVDLDAGFDFADIPEDVLAAFLEDMAMMMSPRLTGEPFEVLPRTATAPVRFGQGEPARRIVGDVADLATWLSGRAVPAGLAEAGELPTIPAWL